MCKLRSLSFSLLLASFSLMTSCGSKKNIAHTPTTGSSPSIATDGVEVDFPKFAESPEIPAPPTDPLLRAEWDADTAARSILSEGRKMALEERLIVRGSCWDYINEVFRRAGYAARRETVFKSKETGPYATLFDIAPGDWLYHVNYSYGTVHSGIFVYWEDEERMIGTTLSYGGEHRNAPGRYRTYDLSGVYQVIRPAGSSE